MLLSVADVALLQGSESRGKRLSKKSIAGADAVAALTDDDLRCAHALRRANVGCALRLGFTHSAALPHPMQLTHQPLAHLDQEPSPPSI
jgi:hypothetical protein